MTAELSFPRQQARTQRFSLGVPRAFTVAPDGSRVLFLRSASGTDRRTGLWSLDVESGRETPLFDPFSDSEDLSPEERARRERSRESAAGVVGYATDSALTVAAFALSGKVHVTDLATGATAELATPGPVIDPRPDPTGRHVAYAVVAGELRVVGVDGSGDRGLAVPDGDEVTWGVAEFIAAEEMDRFRGYWWAPDGERLLAARVDNKPVQRWHIADPANPGTVPAEIAYPAAGTANADVSLAVLGLDGSRVDVQWDRVAFPYLATAHWSAGGAPLLLVQSRDQRTQRVLALDPATGATSVLHEDSDPQWVDIMPGVPAWTKDGRLVRIAAIDGAWRLVVGDDVLTDGSLQVRSVTSVTTEDILVRASEGDPTQIHTYRVRKDGVERLSVGDGVHAIARNGDVTVRLSTGLGFFGTVAEVFRGSTRVGGIESLAETPSITPNVQLLELGERGLRGALLLPTGYVDGPLPVLLDPYGGPHAQRVVQTRNAFTASQWLADQGFAVLVVDGRGTPGRGPGWERAIHLDFAGATLDDQVDALHAAAAQFPFLDLSRVAIRGWSYGGYLSALAVLRRPDVFRAGIAGAPVTDWRLYDTHYTERYLGNPVERPEVYDANSLIEDAPKLSQDLMIIHGLADDNVVAAHTLRLSSALLAAGRPHTVLPLSGVTHMTPQEQVAENLLLLQVDFLKRSLR
ncbi:prolyl oligopeptidase family serine peptidase [Kutzneria sp. 744]|uniref:S9 family peptidase n=1 Tax=Kutzneria sp. (strain 744) TaxID=345341 RepID=UPI0003EED013|nr:prolyl oligopeptidase family serine peptidase [Kutzneria sp. 744]EWM12428.1 dipeptidyl-peptidase 4 [Kutzneria sp. 744]